MVKEKGTYKKDKPRRTLNEGNINIHTFTRKYNIQNKETFKYLKV